MFHKVGPVPIRVISLSPVHAKCNIKCHLTVALGIHSAIEEACGTGYFGICEAFRNMGERRQKILEGIKTAT